MKQKKYQSELDFNSILKKPIKAFGMVFIYFISVILALGIYFVWNMDNISFNTFPGSALDTLSQEREVEKKIGSIQPAMDLNLVLNPTDEFIQKGKEEYNKICASCHGELGQGDGVGGTSLDPKPRNFLDPQGWKNDNSLFGMYKTLAEGIPNTGMIAYNYFSPEVRIAIIHYVRTFGDFPEITEDEVYIKLENAYRISLPTVEPNHIPIKLAISKLVVEESKLLNLRDWVVDQNYMKGFEIVKKYSLDVNNTLITFFTNYTQNLNLHKFIKSVSSAPYSYFFTGEILNLKQDEWNKLFVYLKALYAKVNVSS